jgi:hypothetical protein
VVVKIPYDDVPPLGWDQWASALVAQGDVGAALRHPADGARASSSRAEPTSGLEQGREHADARPAHFVEAQAEQGLWQELRDHDASLNRVLNEVLRIHSGPAWRVFQVSWVSWSFRSSFSCFLCVRVFSDGRSSCLACWRQELERGPGLNADLHWYRGQYETLDALVEALRSPDRWLANKAEALLDLPPEQGAQAAGGASAVERVQVALVERDDALRRAREDMEGACSVAAAWEAEVVTAGAQLQQGRAALEETEGLKTALADKAAALTAAEEQLRQERAARREAKGQLQQERPHSLRPGPRSSRSAWCGRRRWANSSRSAPRSRGNGPRSSSRRRRCRGSTVSWFRSASHMRICAQEASFLKLQR